MRARSRRTAAAVVAIALPVCFAGTISIVDATQIHAATTQGLQRLVASDVLTAPGPGLDPSVVGAIRSEPAVAGAVGLAPTTVYIEPLGGPSTSEAVTPGPLGSVLNLKVTTGSLSHFGPGDVALSTLIAGKGAMDAHVGEAITAYLADGTPYRAQVTAIFSRSAGFADVLIPTGAAGGGHLGTNSLAQVLVAGSKQTSPTALHSAIGSLAARYPGMQAASRSVANAQYELANSQTSYANNLLLSLVGLLAGLALVNTLVLVTLQGREELLLLRRVGATVRQLLAMTAFRFATVVLVGVVLGAGAQIVAIAAASKAIAGSWTPYVPAGRWPSSSGWLCSSRDRRHSSPPSGCFGAIGSGSGESRQPLGGDARDQAAFLVVRHELGRPVGETSVTDLPTPGLDAHGPGAEVPTGPLASHV